MLAGDKSALSEILKEFEIPVLNHKLMLAPRMEKYISTQGNWNQALQYFKSNSNLIVCKPNVGTGGKDVVMVKSVIELEQSIHYLFSKYRSIALSPYINIKNEYRIIVLDGEAELVYKKSLPYVIGDGKNDTFTLAMKKFNNQSRSLHFHEYGEEYNKILAVNEKFNLSWKNNLGLGADPEILEKSDLYQKITKIACEAAKAINIRFASVDIIESAKSELMVLEINSGVMTENLLEVMPEMYDILKNIYKKAILKMFDY